MTKGIQDRRVIAVDNWTDFNRTDELRRSDDAHEYAKKHIYPQLFTPRNHSGTPARGELIYTNGIQQGGKALEEDRTDGIDTTIWWRSPQYGERDIATPLATIQERARHPRFKKLQDLTLTFMNPTGVPGDWFKCRAEFYLYGFFDLEDQAFEGVYLIRRSSLFLDLLGNRQGSLKVNDKGQQFLTVSLDRIRRAGGMAWEQLDNSTERFLASLEYAPIAI